MAFYRSIAKEVHTKVKTALLRIAKPVFLQEVYTMPDGTEKTPASEEEAKQLEKKGGFWDLIIKVSPKEK